ncbi:SMI1/KNR4 family protein [Nonomuraea sp. NPDC005983]|uniref:SMI1/KNR4 family protein n=1 Tax=Nonomuraea sp. NPDC005983 TaxID=3155595 RepID=UPI0033BE2CF4
MTDGPKTSELSEILREMCTQIAGAAPEGWLRATVNGFVDKQGVGLAGVSYRPAAGDEQAVEVDLRRGLRHAYRVSGLSEQGLSIELTVDASGRFEAVTGCGVSRVSHPKRGFLYVIKPETLPPDPGDEQDGPAELTPAGDPEEAVWLLREYLRRRAECLGGMLEDPSGILPAPLPSARLAEMESRLNVALPADLRALYGVADGDGQVGLFGRLSWWMDALGVAAVHGGDRHWAPRGWRDRPFQPFWPFVHDADPPGTVRRSVDRRGWIPFVIGTDGNYLAVDMDPASGGRPGQVIRIGPGYYHGPTYVADSVTTLLRRYVDALVRGDHRIGEDGDLRIDVPEPHKGAGTHLQTLRVTEGGEADLQLARQAPFLRAVELSRCPSADLTALREAPIETLDIDLKTIDLAPLAGHPTLRAVTLTTPHPVDLDTLRALPHLEGLDLSRASTRGIQAIAELDGLLYLALRYEQWQELWAHTDRIPALTAALLAGKAPYDKVADWTAQFNARTVDRRPTAQQIHYGHR